jgi:hypothetical protein
MPRRQQYTRGTKHDREAVGALRERGYSVGWIALLLKLNPKFVRRWHDSQLNFGHVVDQPRSGRPRKRTATLVHRVRRRLSNRPGIRAVAGELGVDKMTVSRAAADAGIHAFHAPKKPLLTDAHRKARLQFAREHVSDDWSNALFTDEKRFCFIACCTLQPS